VVFVGSVKSLLRLTLRSQPCFFFQGSKFGIELFILRLELAINLVVSAVPYMLVKGKGINPLPFLFNHARYAAIYARYSKSIDIQKRFSDNKISRQYKPIGGITS